MRRPRSSADLEAAIGSAVEETDRSTLLANDLLFLARGDRDALALHRQSVDVDELVRRVCHRFGPRAAEAGRRIEIASARCVLAVDAMRVEQAVTNLLDNALTHGAGEVSVSVTDDAAALLLTVADDGPGFARDVLPHAFERFVRSPAAGRAGAGLGLSVVAAVSEAHGGQATARNRPTTGAAVTIFLPRAVEPGS